MSHTFGQFCSPADDELLAVWWNQSRWQLTPARSHEPAGRKFGEPPAIETVATVGYRTAEGS